MNTFSFPDWIAECRIEDELFGQAYDDTPAHFRAWLKKTIAQLWVSGNPDSGLKKQTACSWSSGFSLRRSETPVDAVILALDSGSVSPVRVLAALVPALTAGVQNVLALHVGSGNPSPSVLAALELAGQENVATVDAEGVTSLLEYCRKNEAGTVFLDLRSRPEIIKDNPYVRYWLSPQVSRIALCGEGNPELRETIAFAHPDLLLIECSLDNVDGSFQAVIMPDGIDQGGVGCHLVLGPGQEGCWMWHDLPDSFFKRISLSLTDC